MMRVLSGLPRLIFTLFLLGGTVLAVGAGLLVWNDGRDLPSHEQLLTYVPATGTRVYAADGSEIAEFAAENRIVVPLKQIPPVVIHAFLAAEDRDFYSHGGINPFSILRAAVADLVRYQRGQRPLGASTITQQLVRHFLLSNRVSMSRKIKEALLAYKIERYLSKDRILEIYLNEIYLGAGAYGVAAAAETYFDRPLDRLDLAEAALLAALPKAPNLYNPFHNPEAAKARRDWVLAGMAEKGWISAAEARAAMAEPVELHPHTLPQAGDSGYFAEEVRRELIARFGEQTVYQGGLTVRTSYTPADQAMAERAFRDGLVAYDRRHGWRGPLGHFATVPAAVAALSGLAPPPAPPGWVLAAVTAADNAAAEIVLKTGVRGRIPLDELRWARPTLDDQRLGPPVYRASQVLHPGDIVLVEALPPAAGKRAPPLPLFGLRQIPDVGGAVVVMEPQTGRVLAMIGGWDYRDSQFNRATQARRQPGSAIKPFVYVTALDSGEFTPSTVIEDAPIEIDQGPGLPKWRPVNYEGGYVGETTLRQALVHSRNLATARLATMIGLPAIARTVEEFGIMDKMPLYYSMALGAGETTVLRLTAAYAMLDNGGHWLRASLIDLVQDRTGKVVYQKGAAYCAACYIVAGPRRAADADPAYRATPLPAGVTSYAGPYADNPLLYRPQKPDPLIDPISDYQIVSMMEGVVQHGTGIKVAAVGKPLAGKTGTSSDWHDGWFVGFSPNLVAGVFVGFDSPKTLGEGETGGNVAAPIFRDFMAAALKDQPDLPFKAPEGAEMVLVDQVTGQPATASDRNTVLEAFRIGTEPGAPAAPGPPGSLLPGQIVPGPGEAGSRMMPVAAAPGTGTGGLY